MDIDGYPHQRLGDDDSCSQLLQKFYGQNSSDDLIQKFNKDRVSNLKPQGGTLSC